MKLGVNVSELAAELAVHRATLYYWKAQEVGAAKPKPADSPPDGPAGLSDRRAPGAGGRVGRRTVTGQSGSAFFQRCLAQSRGVGTEPAGEMVSMPKSAAGRKRKAD